NGLEATRRIKAEFPSVAILVLTVHNDDEHIIGILEAGAAGYLTKSVFDKDVVQAIRSVVAGEAVLSDEILRLLVKRTPSHPTKSIPLDAREKLTVRQFEVLRMAAKGLSNADIAQALNISLRTVKSYLVEVFSKLGVSSRTEAVITVLRAGILTLDDLD
ncbi:LuxR C-terminal-related transcriptional regulator, partial [Chloroflexota bacterium]